MMFEQPSQCPDLDCLGYGEVIDSRKGGDLRRARLAEGSHLAQVRPFLTEHYRTPYHRRRYRCLDCGTRWSTLELRVVDLADRVNTTCDV